MGLKGRYGRLSVLAEGDGGPYCSLHKDQQWFQLLTALAPVIASR